MTPAAQDAPCPTPIPRPRPLPRLNWISQQNKIRRRRKNYEKKINYINGGTQVRKFNFIKIIFHFYINGGAQERKFNFIENILNSLINGVAQTIIQSIDNYTISTMCINFFFSEKSKLDVNADAELVWGTVRSFTTDVIRFFVHY